MISDCKTVWNDCLQVIAKEVSEQNFKTWFSPIIPVNYQEEVLTIQVPSQFFYEWLEDNYVHILKKALDTTIGPEARLEYSVIIDKGDHSHRAKSVNYPGDSNSRPPRPDTETLLRLQGFDSVLNKNYTFDSFIEGDCNRLARSAGHAVAQKPGVTSFNPLLIYGGVGLGKTHLVQAIGNEIKRSHQGKRVLYVTSDRFAGQFIEAVKNNKLQDFTSYYVQVDVLIIDDVQFFAGKEKTQEIFFHVFNHLHQNGNQIVMTSDCSPKDLKGMEERLLSRFKWGLTADLQSPDYETRMAIIKRKMQKDGINIPDSVAEYLAYSVDTNVRELEGVLISLIAHGSLNKREIDLELAKATLKSIVHDIETEVGIDYIQKTVSEFFKVDTDDLKSKTRKKEIVIARQVAMYFSKDYTNHSLKSIGYHFGGRDHSTVIHAVQAVNDMIDTDNRFRNSIEELKKKLKLRTALI